MHRQRITGSPERARREIKGGAALIPSVTVCVVCATSRSVTGQRYLPPNSVSLHH